MKTTTLEFLKAAGIYAQRSCRTGAGGGGRGGARRPGGGGTERAGVGPHRSYGRGAAGCTCVGAGHRRYNPGWDIEAKRATIKSSDKIYRKRGTKWAVEQVIADVFGGGFVTEWNEYGGEPYHFKRRPAICCRIRKLSSDSARWSPRQNARAQGWIRSNSRRTGRQRRMR